MNAQRKNAIAFCHNLLISSDDDMQKSMAVVANNITLVACIIAHPHPPTIPDMKDSLNALAKIMMSLFKDEEFLRDVHKNLDGEEGAEVRRLAIKINELLEF